MQENENEEKIDIIDTLGQFMNQEEIEISQEEAIMKYKENPTNKKNTTATDTTGEDDDLERIKRELLESLERVKKLEKLIFTDKDIEEKKKIKVDKASSSSGKSIHREFERTEREDVGQKERE